MGQSVLRFRWSAVASRRPSFSRSCAVYSWVTRRRPGAAGQRVVQTPTTGARGVRHVTTRWTGAADPVAIKWIVDGRRPGQLYRSTPSNTNISQSLILAMLLRKSTRGSDSPPRGFNQIVGRCKLEKHGNTEWIFLFTYSSYCFDPDYYWSTSEVSSGPIMMLKRVANQGVSLHSWFFS